MLKVNIKIYTALAVLCCTASCLADHPHLSDDQKVKAKAHFQDCIKQEKISAEDANRLRNKDFANPSHSMKCFGTCFFEKIGTLKDSKVQEAVVLQKLGPLIGEKKAKEILSKCNDITWADRCDSGFKIYECFETHETKLFA